MRISHGARGRTKGEGGGGVQGRRGEAGGAEEDGTRISGKERQKAWQVRYGGLSGGREEEASPQATAHAHTQGGGFGARLTSPSY